MAQAQHQEEKTYEDKTAKAAPDDKEKAAAVKAAAEAAQKAVAMQDAAWARFQQAVKAKGGTATAGTGAGTRLASSVVQLDPAKDDPEVWGAAVDQLGAAWVTAKYTTWVGPSDAFALAGVPRGWPDPVLTAPQGPGPNVEPKPGAGEGPNAMAKGGLRLIQQYDIQSDKWNARFDIFGH